MPDSSSKSGSPKQPSSRPPFQEGLAGDPLFEPECRIPARKAYPQDNLHHGPLFRRDSPDSSSKSGSPRQPSSRPSFRRDWPGIRFSSWNAGFQLESGSPRQPSSRPPFQDWPGIRFSSCNAGFQLEKRIPKTTFITAPFSGGIGRGSAFRAGMPDSSSKSGSPRQPSSRPPFRRGPLFPQRLCFVFPHIWLFFSALRGSHVFRAQRRASS